LSCNLQVKKCLQNWEYVSMALVGRWCCWTSSFLLGNIEFLASSQRVLIPITFVTWTICNVWMFHVKEICLFFFKKWISSLIYMQVLVKHLTWKQIRCGADEFEWAKIDVKTSTFLPFLLHLSMWCHFNGMWIMENYAYWIIWILKNLKWIKKSNIKFWFQ
jgi:hypothetical protein